MAKLNWFYQNENFHINHGNYGEIRGVWNNNQINIGIKTDEYWSKYSGEFKNNIEHGKGKIIWNFKDKKKYSRFPYGGYAGEFKNGKVYLFNDEFTNFNDTHIGIISIKLLNSLGYEVIIPKHEESGRTFISKGFLGEAKVLANKNVNLLSTLVSEEQPLIGLEPSAILTIRDEYLDLAEDQKGAQYLAKYTFTIEEFLAREIEANKITSSRFTDKEEHIRLHGHCHQKANSSLVPSKVALGLPKNYKVQLIPSGCCGMAGSFGYEKEHYEVSMKIGELVLFPTVRKEPKSSIICAPGTSCRHQIKDGTERTALHPVEILYNALA